MNNFEFQNPTKIIWGRGGVSKLGAEARRYGRKVLLCTGGGSVRRSGLYGQVTAQLEGCEVYELAGIEPNPKMKSVYEGVALCKKEGIELVLAVGGGSCIDCAKAVAAGAAMDEDIWDFALKKIDVDRALPLGCILTLPATGTEMNGNSVISNWETKEKLPLYGQGIYPAFSILDPELTYTIPPRHTVNGCVDIIIHALEQYFTHTPETPLLDRLTEGLVVTMVENACRVLKEPENYDVRSNIMFCGTVANNHWIGVGKDHDWASHNIEHELSALYDIPHGAGLAVIYPNWMLYAMREDPSKFAQFAERVWHVPSEGRAALAVAEEGARRMRAFFTDIGAPATLGDLGIGAESIPRMAKQAARYGAIGGYRKLEANDIETILEMCL